MTTTEQRAEVELRMPAEGAYVSVLRTTAAGLAARLGFDLGQIEDLRVAVGEACALAIPEADVGGNLTAAFHLSTSHLTVSVSVDGTGAREPDHESFAWQVLDTLASSAQAEVAQGRLQIVLSVAAAREAD